MFTELKNTRRRDYLISCGYHRLSRRSATPGGGKLIVVDLVWMVSLFGFVFAYVYDIAIACITSYSHFTQA